MNERLTEIEQFLKSKGFTRATVKTYCSILKKIFTHIGTEFTHEQVEQLMTRLCPSPRTYNLWYAVINFYTKRYLNYSLIFTRSKVEKSLPTYVTRADMNAMLRTIPNLRHKLAFGMMYLSGMRIGEVCSQKTENVYLDERVIKIHGKGNKERLTFIAKQMFALLEAHIGWLKKNKIKYVFPTYRGHLHERSLQNRLERARNDAHIQKEFTCHDLRHSFAINFLDKTSDLEKLQRILGHSSIRTTQIYTQCRTVDLKQLAMTL